MSKITVKKYDKPFTIIENKLLQNTKKLSFKAIGLLAYMLSLPSDWDYTVNGLTSNSKDGSSAIISGLKELEEYGYLERIKSRDKFGKFTVNYVLYESPKKHKKDVLETSTVVDYPQREIANGETDPYIDIYLSQQNKKTNIKDKEINRDKGEILPPPIKLHYLTNEMLKLNLITMLDYNLENFNDLFKTLDNKYKFDEVLNVARYLFNYASKNKDNIANKYAYLEKAFYDTLENYDYSNNKVNAPDWVIREMESWGK